MAVLPSPNWKSVGSNVVFHYKAKTFFKISSFVFHGRKSIQLWNNMRVSFRWTVPLILHVCYDSLKRLSTLNYSAVVLCFPWQLFPLSHTQKIHFSWAIAAFFGHITQRFNCRQSLSVPYVSLLNKTHVVLLTETLQSSKPSFVWKEQLFN